MREKRGVVYLHGVPGGAAELSLFPGLDDHEHIFAPDRLAAAPHLSFDAYLEQLTHDVAGRFPGGPLHIVGFSLGARIALELGIDFGERVQRIDLIAGAAPLEIGDFLSAMAGRTVFEAARDRPRLFRQMTSIQRALCRISPGLMFKLLFHAGAKADGELAKEELFQRAATRMLASAYINGLEGCRREISAYVPPWADRLVGVRAPVWLWHGTDDSWAPFAMATALKRSLPGPVEIVPLEGLSHYSSLRRALPLVLAGAPGPAPMGGGPLTPGDTKAG